MEEVANSFYSSVIAVLVAIVIVATVMIPVVTMITQNDSIENDGAGWLKLGYAEGTDFDFDFEITNDGTDATVGGQSGTLGDMIYYADSDRVIFSKGTSMYMLTGGDTPTLYTFVNAVSVTNADGTLTIYDGTSVIDTVSSPTWAYYPDIQGVYGFFTDGDLELESDKPKVSVGAYAEVFAYKYTVIAPNGYGDLGLTMSGDYSTGEVIWERVGNNSRNITNSKIIDVTPIDSKESDLSTRSVKSVASGQYTDSEGKWTYDLVDGQARIMSRLGSSINSIAIPNTVSDGTNTYTVFAVGNGGQIINNANLTNSVTLLMPGSSNVIIGNNAFSGLTKITSINLRNVVQIGDTAFEGCTGIRTVTIPDTVTQIGSGAFRGCTSVTTVTLPEGLTTIPYLCFGECTSITTVNFPSTLTTIGPSAFSGCTGLTGTLELPDSVTKVGYQAFRNCSGITDVVMGDNVTYIGGFQNCTGLTGTLVLPDSLITLDDTTYQNCTGLTGTLVLPESLTQFGSNCFEGCSGLDNLIVLSSPTFGANKSLAMSGVKEVLNLGETVLNVDSYGLAADSVQDHVNALGYIAPFSLGDSEPNLTKTLISMLPLIAGVGALLLAVGTMIYTRF